MLFGWVLFLRFHIQHTRLQFIIQLNAPPTSPHPPKCQDYNIATPCQAADEIKLLSQLWLTSVTDFLTISEMALNIFLLFAVYLE